MLDHCRKCRVILWTINPEIYALHLGHRLTVIGVTPPSRPGQRVFNFQCWQRTGGGVAWMERLVRELMASARVPGVAIAVIRDAAVAWHRELGVRDVESRTPVDERTIFELASISKTVFAYAVMQLVDRGVVALDTPLVKYTPDPILTGDARLNAITARHVLSHTTGCRTSGPATMSFIQTFDGRVGFRVRRRQRRCAWRPVNGVLT